MKFREATIEDYESMVNLSINQRADRKMDLPLDSFYTLEHDGKILFVGGYRMIVPTTAWCWLDFTEYGVKRIKDSYRTINEFTEQWVKLNGVSRLQAFTHNGEKEIRLVKHFKFKQECIMKNFYGDEDAILFARVF